jgi:hypothetical protein
MHHQTSLDLLFDTHNQVHTCLACKYRLFDPHADLEEQRMVYSQARVVPIFLPSLPEPVAFRAVVCLHTPKCPGHIGQMIKKSIQGRLQGRPFQELQQNVQHGYMELSPSAFPYSSESCSSPHLSRICSQIDYHIIAMETTSPIHFDQSFYPVTSI